MRSTAPVLVAAVLFALLPLTSRAGPVEKVEIGEVARLQSKVLGEQRTLLVNLPLRYEMFGGRYPVLVLLDGQENFFHVAGLVRFLGTRGHIPELIVVGVVNTDRTRDFTHTRAVKKSEPWTRTSGGGEQFLAFMEQELLPFLEKKYRTQPYRILAGHCLTGLFVTHVLLTRPGLFQAHVAVSPYLAWDDKAILGDIDAALSKHPEREGFYFASVAGEGEAQYQIDKDVDALHKALKAAAPRGLTWTVKSFPREDHDSTVHAAVHEALRTLYAGWRPGAGADLAALTKHYLGLSERFGYEVKIPEARLNLLGYRALAAKKVEEAIAIFSANVTLYPQSANVYDSLGEALEANAQLKPALTNYKKAVEKYKRVLGHDPRTMKVYREHVARVEKKLKAQS